MSAVPICHLRFSDVVGGVETSIIALLGALDPARYQAKVISFPNPPFEKLLRESGIEYETITRGGKSDLGFPLRLRRLLKRLGCRVVHTHGLFSDLYTSLGCRCWAGRPCHVLTKHTFADADRSASARKVKIIDRLDRWVVNPRVHRFVAVSEERRQGMIARHGLNPDRITAIHNGVPIASDFDPASIAPSLREQIGLPASTPLVGFLGRLNPEKGPDVFVEAFATVAQRVPESKAVVIGDGPMREQLERTAAERGIADRMHWLPYRDDVFPLLADIDVVVMPSRTEGLPMLLLEAMAMARPVVVSRVGGMPEVVTDGESGWLCPTAQADAFGERIAEILTRPDELKRVGERGRSAVLERFTARAMAERMMSLYDEVLGGVRR